ncbi:hypothetical protein [Haliangium sp.]|uniref:hypothetical protein n=1 Tax=Haliangium sp. TaxID=2663208 RepID=UPI003D13D57A
MASDVSKRTVIIIFAAIGSVGLILLDMLLMSQVFSDSKIIVGFGDYARHGALIPLGIAVLAGHWFTPIRDGTPLVRRYNYLILGLVAGVMALVHTALFIVFALTDGSFGAYGGYIAFISVVLGLVMGATLWPVHMHH